MRGGSVMARAVMLDLDGVLADSRAAIQNAWREWAEIHDLAACDVLTSTMGTRSEDIIREIAPYLDAAAETVWLEEREGRYPVTACAGAAEFVATLKSTPWAVVTSGRRRTAIARLRMIGIPIPEVLITASDIERGKPHPEGYLSASRALGVAPEESVVIEDSAVGVKAARSAGAQVIGIRGAALAGAAVDMLVTSLRELRVSANGKELTFTLRERGES